MTIAKLCLLLLNTGGLLALAACNLPTSTPEDAGGPAVFYTAAAQTLQAQGTLLVETPHPTNPSNSPVSPLTTQWFITPTVTSGPSVITQGSTSTACDRVAFVDDLTIPDNTPIVAGSRFTKTWRLQNIGSCTWNSGYALVFIDGETMGAPAAMQLGNITVAPGQMVDISIVLTAPTTLGTHRSEWKLRNPSGTSFGVGPHGDRTFWVKVKVVAP